MTKPHNTAGIRVQTARMLEIYSLLRRELEGGNRLGLSRASRARLESAIGTIATNMRQLAALLAAATETPSAAPAGVPRAADIELPGMGRMDAAEARELEEILDAVLKWHAELEEKGSLD